MCHFGEWRKLSHINTAQYHLTIYTVANARPYHKGLVTKHNNNMINVG